MKTYEAKGMLDTKFWSIIPFIFSVSKSVITSHRDGGRNGIVNAIHITPFFGIAIHWAVKIKEVKKDE